MPTKFPGTKFYSNKLQTWAGKGKYSRNRAQEMGGGGEINGRKENEDIWKTTNIYSVNRRVKESKVKQVR